MTLISFSLEVAGVFSVLSERLEVRLQDEKVSKRRVSFLIEKFYFSEGWSWRRREDEVEKVEMFLTGGKIFLIKGALWNLLLGIKDEWEYTLDDIADATKADATNEALEFLDAEVSIFYDEGFDFFLVYSALFFEDLSS